jgi:hypothetical protein
MSDPQQETIGDVLNSLYVEARAFHVTDFTPWIKRIEAIQKNESEP